jgi:hypothetical protein
MIIFAFNLYQYHSREEILVPLGCTITQKHQHKKYKAIFSKQQARSIIVGWEMDTSSLWRNFPSGA